MLVRNSVSWRSDVSRTRSAGPHIQAKLSADSADSSHRVTNNRNLSQSCQVDFKPFFQTKILFCLKTFPVKGENRQYRKLQSEATPPCLRTSGRPLSPSSPDPLSARGGSEQKISCPLAFTTTTGNREMKVRL